MNTNSQGSNHVKIKQMKSMTGQGKKHPKNFLKALGQTDKNGFLDKIMHFYQSQDLFGETVQFTFQGNKHFKTNYGAFISIVIKCIMVTFIAYECYVVFTRKHPMISIKEILNNMDDSHGGIAPFYYGFDIAVGLQTRVPDSSISG